MDPSNYFNKTWPAEKLDAIRLESCSDDLSTHARLTSFGDRRLEVACNYLKHIGHYVLTSKPTRASCSGRAGGPPLSIPYAVAGDIALTESLDRIAVLFTALKLAKQCKTLLQWILELD